MLCASGEGGAEPQVLGWVIPWHLPQRLSPSRVTAPPRALTFAPSPPPAACSPLLWPQACLGCSPEIGWEELPWEPGLGAHGVLSSRVLLDKEPTLEPATNGGIGWETTFWELLAFLGVLMIGQQQMVGLANPHPKSLLRSWLLPDGKEGTGKLADSACIAIRWHQGLGPRITHGWADNH